MSHLLTKWLNEDVGLSKRVANLDKDLSNGYLLGELLYAFGMQEDFPLFRNKQTADTKVSNFSRLEPTFRKLKVTFNSKVVNDLMTEKKGVATRMIYNLKNILAPTVQDNPFGNTSAMNSSVVARVQSDATKLAPQQDEWFEQTLKKKAPNQKEISMNMILKRFSDEKVKQAKRAKEIEQLEDEFETEIAAERREYQMELMSQSRKFMKEWEDEGRKNHNRNQSIKREREKMELRYELSVKESEKLKGTLKKEVARKDVEDGVEEVETTLKRFGLQVAEEVPVEKELATMIKVEDPREFVASLEKKLPEKTAMRQQAEMYLTKVKGKKQEETFARKEREKRRRRAMLDQMRMQEEVEEKRREELLLDKLLRQSQEERRIAERLWLTRQEKEIIRENRIFREQQYESRRQMEYEEARKREEAIAKLEREKYLREAAAEKERFIEQERARKAAKAKANYDECHEVVCGILDLAMKVSHYREYIDELVPEKEYKEWLRLFGSGQPINILPDTAQSANEEEEEETKVTEADLVLDEAEYDDFYNSQNLWSKYGEVDPPNYMLGSIIKELDLITNPLPPPPEPPQFSKFPLKAALVGKPFTGKTTFAGRLSYKYGATVISVDDILAQAITAEGGEAPDNAKLLAGSSLSDEESVNLIVAEIRRIEANDDPNKNKGWILDGFPRTRLQAELLEKALTGYETPPEEKPGKKSKITKPPPEKPESPRLLDSGIDIVIRLDLDNEVVAKRAVGRRMDPETGVVYHLEFDPPPEEDGLFERLVPVMDPSSEVSQLNPRIEHYVQQETGIEEWLNKFGNLKPIDASPIMPDVNALIDDTFALIIERKEKEAEAEEQARLEEEERLRIEEEQRLEAERVKAEEEERLRKEEEDKLAEEEALIAADPKAGAKKKKEREEAEKKAKEEAAKAAAEAAAAAEEEESGPVEKPIEEDLAANLIERFDTVEQEYVEKLKSVFRSLRCERNDAAIQYHDYLKHFRTFVARPDKKQEAINEFQAIYNQVEYEMRYDDEMKEEFHQRIVELQDHLWTVSDDRKDENEAERRRVMGDGFTAYKMQLLSNHFLELIQSELDRYRMTRHILVDYWGARQGEILQDNLNPLLDEPVVELAAVSAVEPIGLGEVDLGAGAGDAGKTAGGKADKKAPAKKGGKGGKDDKKAPARKQSVSQVGGEEESLERAQMVAENEKIGVVVARVLDLVPKTDVRPVPEEREEGEESKPEGEEEPAQASAFEEALYVETEILERRLKRLAERAKSLLEDYFSRSSSVYEKMDELVAKQFMGEMSAVKGAVASLQEAVESEEQLHHPIVLDGANYEVDEDSFILKPEDEIIRPSVEYPDDLNFTCLQIAKLVATLRLVSTNGVIPGNQFRALLRRLAGTSYGHVHFPSKWNIIAKETGVLDGIVKTLDPTGTGLADWRELVVTLIFGRIPPPEVEQIVPFHNLLSEGDPLKEGFVPKDIFERSPSWLDDIKIEETQPHNSFAVGERVKELLYQIFKTGDDGRVDYRAMITLLCRDTEESGGLEKAFQVFGEGDAVDLDTLHFLFHPDRRTASSAHDPASHSVLERLFSDKSRLNYPDFISTETGRNALIHAPYFQSRDLEQLLTPPPPPPEPVNPQEIEGSINDDKTESVAQN